MSKGANMKNIILALAATSLVAASAFAGDSTRTNKHEAAGLGSGLAIGAAVGGPIGAIIGAAAGAVFGNKYHEERTAHFEFESQYELARADVEDLSKQLQGREQRIAEMQRTLMEEERNYRAAVQEALNAEVFFRTGESELSEDSIDRIGRIAGLVGSMDGFVVRLAGHADNRGDEDYNEQLSAARAAAVRDALISAGFPNSRISVSAEGETRSEAAEGDLDALALERRVQIELVSSETDPRVAGR
jgi:outer membrane protein OmpA-like peptidoglycan-associated protein